MTDPDPSRNADLAGLLGRVGGAVTGRVVGAIDPDVVLDHVDVNALLDRVDVDRLLARADVDALVRRSGVPDIVAESTGRFAGTALDTGRRQLVVVDVLLARVIDSLLRRSRSGWSQSPSSWGTPGMTLVGLRVVRHDGAELGAWSSFVRTALLPVSGLLLGLGYALALVHPDRRALHDLVAGSAVVHDWAPRRVELPPAVSASMLDVEP